MSNRTLKPSLLATTIIAGMAFANPAFAQDATNNQPGVPVTAPPGTTPSQQVSSPTEGTGPSPGVDQPQAPSSNTNGPGRNEEIVVTGTLIPRRTTSETPSAVTVISAESMDQRGIQTAGEALQRLSANGSGNLAEGWNNGNNFAAGAIAPSIHGLTVQKTLSLFDGLRMAPYPLADDGHRNFVDISTIPDNVIDRIEVLKDGASSTYGADAVAGVVNIITKKEIQGIHANGSFGISSRGDGRERRLDLSAGWGDLDSQGFNVYLAGTYRKNDVIWARDRDFPINSGDYSKICNDAGSCLANNTRWMIFKPNVNGTLGGSTVPFAPLVAPTNALGQQLATWQLLNTNCGEFNSYDQQLGTVAQQVITAGPALGQARYPSLVCGADQKVLFNSLRPETTRYGLTGRATINVGEKAQAWLEGNYFFSKTFTTIQAAAISNNQTTPPLVALFTPTLPVYVCPQGIATINPVTTLATYTGCNATNGVLNPLNPFAAQGQEALIRIRYDLPQTVETHARALRGAAGISGSFGSNDDWNYNVQGVASEIRLDRISDNYIIPQRIADALATGAYDFAHPSQNTQAQRDFIAPENFNRSTSTLYMADATLNHNLFELPGGPLAAAVGLSYRYEAIDNPSANPVDPSPSFNPYSRYYTINAVGAVGKRNVKSAFFEVNAPITSLANNGFAVEADLSGRYDKYSTGQKNFSPKIGVKVTPIREIALRGTWSKGFRIPSFNESFGLPTTGYANNNAQCGTAAAPTAGPQAAFCAAHQYDPYVSTDFALGRTSVGNPALKPEKSTSYTLGAVLEPIRNVSFTIDYYHIVVNDVVGNISAGDQQAALNAYYLNGNTTAVPGVIVIPGVPDPQFPALQPLPGFIQFSFTNSDQERTSGLDLSMAVNHRFGDVHYSSYVDANYVIDYSIKRSNGDIEKYAGTLSPCDYTSCSGTPRWKGSWQNTFDFGRASLTGTLYYTSGYNLAEVDYGGNPDDCPTAGIVKYQDGTPVKCKVGAQWNFDLAGSYKATKNLTIYGAVLNLFDIKPVFDPSAAYSIFNYNPAFGQPNAIGRFFRIGAKLDFDVPPPPPPAIVAPPPPPPPPATVTCESGAVVVAPGACPAPAAPPPPPPPPPVERGERGQ